jgi:hypothetical protein
VPFPSKQAGQRATADTAATDQHLEPSVGHPSTVRGAESTSPSIVAKITSTGLLQDRP